jgi:hypothetical protein
MKQTSIFIFAFFIFFHSSQAQNKYTSFIEKSSVTWATDATDTARFESPNLSLLLRQQLAKEKIKVAVVEPGSSSATEIRFVKKADIIQIIAPNRVAQVVDSNGNNAGTVIEAEDPLLSSRYFDEETTSKVEVAQILYVESGKLKSYVPWVSTKYTITTSWGERLGIANAFSTAFSTSRTDSRRTKRKSTNLGSGTMTLMMDSTSASRSLKQLYGQNLVQALWPHLGSKNYGLQLPGAKVPIQFSKINQTLIEESPVAVPVYDEEGNVTSGGVILQESQPLNLSQITRIDLVQDWYYHARTNRVFSTTRQIILYAVRSKGGVSSGTSAPILSILVH